ncbi:hypothetical protein MPRF_55380 [Mycolicibacterium parafortuitum]|uniref:Phosphogluconate dehydrogenase NAD-binding putative C-terminal domain-containing protein n=1 Tax=Mycolicibacterium parafortuitum TaxID=39692 RepID=A0A7I7UDA9_MYCPF|nr:hypothetical protein MPRF_55380 [Mycolicibacterium parafortuitum]
MSTTARGYSAPAGLPESRYLDAAQCEQLWTDQERLHSGTRTHAERRAHEMQDTAAYLEELGAPADITQVTENASSRFRRAAPHTWPLSR